MICKLLFVFVMESATTEIDPYGQPLSLHDTFPIFSMATNEGGGGQRIYAFVGAHVGAMGVPGKASSRTSALLQKRSMAREASGGCPRMRCASPFSKGAKRTRRRQKLQLKRFPEFDPESR